MWSPCPSGTTGKTSGALPCSDRYRTASICSATSSMDHDDRCTPGVSATTTLATRPAIATSISPVTGQVSCASKPTTGATNSVPIGGYAETSRPSAILVTADGTMTLQSTPSAAPSSATTLDRPITPALAAA